MPILSYIAFPVAGRYADLERQLAALPGCDVFPAESEEMLLLVTDTPSDEEERLLQARLREIDAIASLALVYGRSEARIERGPASPGEDDAHAHPDRDPSRAGNRPAC